MNNQAFNSKTYSQLAVLSTLTISKSERSEIIKSANAFLASKVNPLLKSIIVIYLVIFIRKYQAVSKKNPEAAIRGVP